MKTISQILKFLHMSRKQVSKKLCFSQYFFQQKTKFSLNYLRLHKIRIPSFSQDKLKFLHRTYNIGSIKWPGWRLEMSSIYQCPLRSTNTTPSDGCEFKFESVKHRVGQHILHKVKEMAGL